jgi:hypothetical protein
MGQELEIRLGKKVEKILQKWIDTILAGYPIKPAIEVEEYVRDACSKILSAVFRMYEGKRVDYFEPLDDLMRFLATDRRLSPGESIKLVGNLKTLISSEIELSQSELEKLSTIIEEIIYKAFDAYMACREEIFQLRLKEKERDLEIMRKIIEFAEKPGKLD